MSPCLNLVEIIDSSTNNNFNPMLDKVLNEFFQRHYFRASLHKSKIDNAKSLLHLCIFKQLIQHNASISGSLQNNNDSHSITVGFIAYLRDIRNLFVINQISYLLNKCGFVNLVRYFSNHNLLTAVSVLFYIGTGAHRNFAATGMISLFYAFIPVYNSASGKIRSRNVFHQLFGFDVGIFDIGDGSINNFSKI